MSPCAICRQPLGPKEPSYERVETWTLTSGKHRGHGLVLPKPLNQFAHVSCVDSAKKGFQTGMWGT